MAGSGARVANSHRSGGRRRYGSSGRLGRQRRRRGVALIVVILAAGAVVYLASAGRSPHPPSPISIARVTSRRGAATAAPARRAASAPHVTVTAPAAPTAGWITFASVHGRPAAWLSQRAGVTLMRFDQHLVHLTLHAGSRDGGVAGWTYGDKITPREVHLLVAGFNGGFKLTYTNVGFMSGGHVAVPLKSGLASLVTYTNGTTNIGAWHEGVPSAHETVFSVLQNQHLLVDRGVAAANVSTCVIDCWGGTIKYLTVVARSGLGITAAGALVWAAGEQLSPASLANALIDAGAVRAIELDINPFWVAGYLYTHQPSGPVAVPVVPGQRGIIGQLLAPNTRDFLAVVAR